SSFILAHDGSNRPYPFIQVAEGHHDLSHHGNDQAKLEKIAKINRFHITQLAYFLEKLKSIKEGDGTLLDNCMIVYGSGIGDGNRHNHDNLPVLLAGKGGGTIQTGRHVRYERETPMNNLFLSMLDRIGAAAAGDSRAPHLSSYPRSVLPFTSTIAGRVSGTEWLRPHGPTRSFPPRRDPRSCATLLKCGRRPGRSGSYRSSPFSEVPRS